MVATLPQRTGTSSYQRAWYGLTLVLSVVALPSLALAQERGREEGLVISVPVPLDTRGVNQIKADAARAIDQADRPVTLLILDFNPTDRAASSEDYGACWNLADFLLKVNNVNTVAFVHRDVTGHLVLPVLACHEIVMASEAKLGDVPRGQKGPLRKDQLAFYEEVINARGRCPALVLKMLDPAVEVIEATRGGARWYIDRRRVKEEEKNNIVPVNLTPILPAEIGLYTGKEAQRFGLSDPRLIESRQELIRARDLPASSLRNPLQGRKPIARRFELRGELDRGKVETLKRSLRKAIGIDNRANFLLLELNCAGGDLAAARDLAEWLTDLRDNPEAPPVMTLAYIPKEAPDVAAILALGCTEIAMHKEAKFGDFSRVVDQAQDPKELEPLKKTLEGLAEKQGYSPLLMRGFLEPDLVLYRVRTVRTPIERTIVSAAGLAEKDKDGNPKWQSEGQIKEPGKLLVLETGDRAQELRIARTVIDDPTQLYTRYGLDPTEVRLTGPDWLDQISEFLRRPVVGFFLIMIGITCLILELKMPGLGLPGVLAALCFVLYFWAHSQLAGQIIWLAVLLFLLGLILIGVEIFVIPGFGVTGLSGILLLLTSLTLVTLEKKPETSQEWVNFGGTLSLLGFSLVGAIVVAMLVARSLPNLPYAHRLVLQPPGEAAAAMEEAGLNESPTDRLSPAALALLGAIGVAVTPLRPAGMARFGDEFVDVVAEGSYVEAGLRIQVIEIEGNRVTVKEV